MACNQVTIRPATSSDANCLAVLATQVWLDTYATEGVREAIALEVLSSFSKETIRTHLSKPDVTFMLAEIECHLVGFSQWTLGTEHELVPGANQAELDRLYVQERFTRRGIGTLLLAASERAAKTQGADVLWLTPWARNERALGFYAKRGYSDLGSTVFRMGAEVHENRVLATELASNAE